MPPRKRIDAVRRLNEAGVPSGVLMGPVLPAMSDQPEQLEEVIEAAVDAGARFISGMYLHLRGPLKGHWFDWLAEQRPDLLRQHGSLYNGRAYVPDADQRRLSRLIRTLVEKHGGADPDRTWTTEDPDDQPTSTQLELGI